MLKRNIKYTNFNEEEVTSVFYFNLSKPELIELEAGYTGGLQASIQRIMEANDPETLLKEFKRIILLSYGIKSDDGEYFVKSDEIRERFTQSAAYHALYMELATDEDAASAFIIGITPKDVQEDARKSAQARETLTYNPDLGGPIPQPPPMPLPGTPPYLGAQT